MTTIGEGTAVRGALEHVLAKLRPVADGDAQDLFGLLSLCFAEYPGCFVDPHGDLPDLLRPAETARRNGLSFWVLEDANGRVCACVAFDRPEPGLAELHRLYVRPDRRRRGIAGALVGHVERAARAEGAARLQLWSDTRFVDAHRLYERLGFRRGATERELGDISASVEAFFVKDLSPGA